MKRRSYRVYLLVEVEVCGGETPLHCRTQRSSAEAYAEARTAQLMSEGKAAYVEARPLNLLTHDGAHALHESLYEDRKTR